MEITQTNKVNSGLRADVTSVFWDKEMVSKHPMKRQKLDHNYSLSDGLMFPKHLSVAGHSKFLMVSTDGKMSDTTTSSLDRVALTK